jgi:phosphoribosylglycinamide formyltransferase-1
VRKVAVFASGSGSNYEALMNSLQQNTRQDDAVTHLEEDGVEVALLVTDKPQAYVIVRAQKWGTPTFAVSAKDFTSKKDFEERILVELKKHNVDFIVLAGYMRILGPTLLQGYMGRILNIHPSLLPAFPGKDAIGQAIDYGVQITGITIHFVDEGMDTGPIIYQEAISIDQDETKESLAQKMQKVEHQNYPLIIQQCVNGEIVLEERKVKWVQKSNER